MSKNCNSPIEIGFCGATPLVDAKPSTSQAQESGKEEERRCAMSSGGAPSKGFDRLCEIISVEEAMSEICGSVSREDGLRSRAVCVRPKGHSNANGLGNYHGTEQDIYASEGGYYWYDYSEVTATKKEMCGHRRGIFVCSREPNHSESSHQCFTEGIRHFWYKDPSESELLQQGHTIYCGSLDGLDCDCDLRSTPIDVLSPPNDGFDIWWKENFGDPKNAAQEMAKSTAYHAWQAGVCHEGAIHTKWAMKRAVSLFEIGVISEKEGYTNTRAEAAEASLKKYKEHDAGLARLLNCGEEHAVIDAAVIVLLERKREAETSVKELETEQ